MASTKSPTSERVGWLWSAGVPGAVVWPPPVVPPPSVVCQALMTHLLHISLHTCILLV